jgi:hypothetical protein
MTNHVNLTRRRFIQLGSAILATASTRFSSASADAQPLKGFIVSDAHFGWGDPKQPAPAEQEAAVRRILEQFPDLDVFIDTGDPHHGDVRGAAADQARADWTRIIANACDTAPFYYVGGNHDLMTTHGEDAEWRCAQLGSLTCRPYYSFDLCGVHFIALPQLMRTVYLNREALEWLDLDLALNRERTTLILSHNNIIGTTRPVEPGYRGLVESKRILTLIESHPNILAWLHGHNHNFEVVQRGKQLFVSNGRIGGFDASWRTPYGLGGIYFEVGKAGIEVRSFTADLGFLDEADIANVSGRIDSPTTLDRSVPAAHSYGFGGARDGLAAPVYHHHVGGTRTLHLRGEQEAAFNDDPEFRLYMLRRQGGKNKDRQLMGSDVLAPHEHWEYADPGIRLLPRLDGATTTVSVPMRGMGENCYYACVPGKAYRFTLDVQAEQADGTVAITARMLDRDAREVGLVKLPPHAITEGTQTVDFDIAIPEDSSAGTLYAEAESDNTLHLMLEVEISGLETPLLIQRARLEGKMGTGTTFCANGVVLQQNSPESGASPHFPSREVMQISTGEQRVSWLIREQGLRWQVRNAPAHMEGSVLHIGPVRSPWTPDGEIVIVPLTNRKLPYVARLRNIDSVEIHTVAEQGDSLRVVLAEAKPGAEIVVANVAEGARVKGAAETSYQDGRLTIRPEALEIQVNG